MVPMVYDFILQASRGRLPCQTDMTFTQSDRGVHRLRIKVFDGADEFDYSSATEAKVIFAKPDGTRVLGEGVVHDECLTYDMGVAELESPGIVNGWVQLWNDDGQRFTTSDFSFRVANDPLCLTEPTSVSNAPDLMQLITEMKEAAQAVNAVTASFSALLAEHDAHAHAHTKLVIDGNQ